MTIGEQVYSEDLLDPSSPRFIQLERFINKSMINLYALTPRYDESVLSVTLLPTIK